MIGVLGSGSWATEIVHILQEQSPRKLNWWVRESDKVEELKGTSRLNVSSNIQEVIEASDDIFVVIPSAFICSSLQGVTAQHLAGKNIISAAKGFIADCNLTITSYFAQQYGISDEHLCVVSGPSHAEEVARCQLTYLTVAGSNNGLIERVREMLACDWICTQSSDDRTGVECAAALKNIYAVAAGLCTALDYGDNLLAVLLANALHEMDTFMKAYMHDDRQRDMSRYVYLSDLLATAYSKHSRNRTLGELIGRGYSPNEARLMQKMVAEGYYAVDIVERLCQQFGIVMPIAQSLYRILYKGCGARREMRQLTHSFTN